MWSALGKVVDVELGASLPERKRLIQRLTAAPSDRKYSLRFQGRAHQLDVYTVAISFPKYRLSNGRTQALQEQFLAAHPDLPRDFFSRDQEAESAQAEQHKLLKSLVSEAGLYNYFKKNPQDDPLILTSNGIVVNGNRRLCAMRELLADDPQKFVRFRNVQVVFLPACSEEDIDELEAQLQIIPDIKAEYTWVARACMMRRRQADHGYDALNLSRIYQMPQKDVAEELELLALADQYLDFWGSSKKYDMVTADEFAFRTLRKDLRGLHDPKEREFLKAVAFVLIKNKPEGAGRLHTFIDKVAKDRSVIASRLHTFLGEPVINDQVKAEEAVHEDPADAELLGSAQPIYEVSGKLRDPSKADELSRLVIDVVEGERAKKRQEDRENSVVLNLINAYTNVQSAALALSSSTYKPEVPFHIRQIEDALKDFTQKIKRYDHH